MPKDVRIWWDPSLNSYRIQSPFSEEFVKRIKDARNVPWQERGWDAQARTWAFGESYLDLILSWVKELWPGIFPTIKYRAEVEREARGALPSGEFSFFQKASVTFMEHMDAEALTAAFKSRAQRLHPDKGGNSNDFSEFNSAYIELKKEFQK